MRVLAVIALLFAICKAASVRIYPSLEDVETSLGRLSSSDDSSQDLIPKDKMSADTSNTALVDIPPKGPSNFYKTVALLDMVQTLFNIIFGLALQLACDWSARLNDVCESKLLIEIVLAVFAGCHLLALPLRFGVMIRDGSTIASSALFNGTRSGIFAAALALYFMKPHTMEYLVMALTVVFTNILMELGCAFSS